MRAQTGSTSLVGRSAELDVLREALSAAAAGRGRAVLIEGEPGIGKTRLVQVACDLARADGFDVAMGTCDDLIAGRPFGALAQALGVGDDATDSDRVAIGALLDAHDSYGGTSTAGGTPNPGAQYRVVDALGALVERLATRAPLLLALDDLQWADPSTLVALRSIARRIDTLPVAVVGSFREGHHLAELHRITDDLLRAGAVRIGVGPLDDDAIASLVTEVMDSEPSEGLLDRLRGASGNPLFVIEYVRSAHATAAPGPESDTALEFRRTILRRLTALSDPANDALRLASVLGSTFAAADLAAVSGTPIVELAPLVHEMVVNGIVEERREHLAFRHALVRDAIYDHIPFAVRRQLHSDAGRALAAAGSDALVVAHHLALGASEDDAEAVDWLRRAAREAAPKSPSLAVDLFQRARELLDPLSASTDGLLAELAVALAWAGRLPEAEELSMEVLGRHPGPDVAGPLRCGLVYALTWQGKLAEALQHTVLQPDERLAERDETLLTALAAVANLFAFDLRTAGGLATTATLSAARLGHELAHCHALTVQAWVALFGGRPREATDLARQAVEIADRSATGDAHLAHPRFFPGMPLLFLDRIDEADEMLTSGARLAERLGLPWSLPLYHAFLGAKGFIAGDWDSAVTECEAALAVADEVGLHIGVMAATAAWLAVIQLHRDDLEGAERTIAAAMGNLSETGPQLGMGPLIWARAMLHEARDEREEALGLLQVAWDLYMAGGPVTDPWSAMTFVRLCAATGDHERAAALLPAIEEQSAATGTPFMQGQALRCRALVERDPELLLRALPLYRDCPRPFERAAACEDAAALLASSGRVDEAIAIWDEAVEVYGTLGAERAVNRVSAQLRAHGIKRGARRRHVRATTGWESLTETEHKVIALVIQRLSNPEVADRLFISRHTVESHLKHIYRKLELSSRLELTAVAEAHA